MNPWGKRGSSGVKWVISQERLKTDLLRQVEDISGEKLSQCYQCGKCSAGCPIAFAMDYTPNQILRMVQLGMVDPVLSSRTIWLCASCETCTTRCPRELDLVAIMDALRITAQRRNIRPRERTIPLFNRLFLLMVRKYGRAFEPELIMRFNLNSGLWFKDIFKAPMLFLRGKLRIFPALSDARAVRRIFKNIKKLRARK